MRKIVLSIIIALIIILGAAWFFIVRQSESFSENSAFMAIPTKTPLVVEVPSVKSLLNEVSSNNPLVNELQSIPGLQTFWNDINSVKTLLEANPQLGKIVQGKSLLVAFNLEGKDNTACLFAFSLKNRSEVSSLIDLASSITQSNSASLTKRTYDNTDIYLYKSGNEEFHFAEENGIFLFSRYALFVEEAIRQISADNLLDQELFQSLYTTVSSSSSLNLFINHSSIPQLLEKASTSKFRSMVRQISDFSDWTELDVKLNDSEFLMSGFSFSNDNYLNVFSDQEAGRFDMDEALSANTSLFINLNLQDFAGFQEKYEAYLKQEGSYYTRETKLKALEKYSKEPFISILQGVVGDNFAITFGQVLQNEPTINRFFIVEVKGQSVAMEVLLPVLENYAKAKDASLEDMQSSYQISSDKSYTIYQFPFNDMPELLFGKAFSAVESNYMCLYDNYIIFSDSDTALKSYIHDLEFSETLEKDISFQKFNQEMSSRSNFYFYMNLSKAFNLKDYYLQDNLAEALKLSEMGVRKFYALGWQFSENSGEFLNNLYLKFTPVVKEEPQIVWQTKLESTISSTPQIVDNHNDPKNKEVIIQDDLNNLYLINKEGTTLWNIGLPEKILSDIYQVDYYRNGKLQYLFNTKSQLFLIDRNGKNVAKFPIKFSSPTTNGVSVFDYDNSRNYRFFVACENKQVFAYDRDGNVVSGWKFDKTEGEVKNPIKHLRVENKDYIVFSDQYKTYLLDRQGNTRVPTSDRFNHSGNDLQIAEGNKTAIVTTDTEGLVHIQYFDGESAILDIGKYGKAHYFKAEDLNADGKTDFIIADENEIFAFSDKGKKMFNYKLDKSISEIPAVFSFPTADTKIGIVCEGENQIYLLSTNGNLSEGFPLQGNTDFSVGSLTEGSAYLNLLVGSEDHSFLNYKIE